MAHIQRRNLSVDVHTILEESFSTAGTTCVFVYDVFMKDNLAIHSNGIRMRNTPKEFQVVYEELVLGEVLGRGASSVVIHAVHASTGMPLALKSKRQQVMREINTLYDAECLSLVNFYGAFYREGNITIALEYMDGGSLANILDQVGAIPEFALANMAFQILWGLAYLRAGKKVHRDIKPSNLLINQAGRVKLSDFGISSSLDASMQMCGTFVGTCRYMSPERVRNEKYSFASDIWSFGLTLIECATAEYSYAECSSFIELVQMVLENPSPCLPAERYFSPQFHDFVMSCTHQDPARRPPSSCLLESAWLGMNGATSFENAVANVRLWIHSLRERK